MSEIISGLIGECPLCQLCIVPELRTADLDAIVTAYGGIIDEMSEWGLHPKFTIRVRSFFLWMLTRCIGLELTTAKEVLGEIALRENLGSTAIGRGIAKPHLRHTAIKRASLCIVRLEDCEIEFDCPSENPTVLFACWVCPYELWSDGYRIDSGLARAFRMQHEPYSGQTVKESIAEAFDPCEPLISREIHLNKFE